MIPKTADFSELEVSVNYEDLPINAVATLDYSYNGHKVGSTAIEFADNTVQTFDFSNIIRASSQDEVPKRFIPSKNIVFVSITRIILILASLLALILLFFFIKNAVSRYKYSAKRDMQKVKKRYKKRRKNFFR